MAVSHDVKNLPQAKSASFWRRCWFPLVVLIIFGGIFATPWVWVALDIHADAPVDLFMMTQWGAPVVAALLIGLWWLFFSSFRWTTRLAGAALVALAITGFCLSLRNVELTKGRVALVPRFHFAWEPTPNEQLAAFLDRQPAKGAALSPIDAQIGPEDFPRFRGAKIDGLVPYAILDTDWNTHPPKELWRHASPGGYSGIAVAGNIVVTLEERDTGETVACYDRVTGLQRWAYSYAANYKDPTHMGDGPRSTPTIYDDRVYSIGASGDLMCLDVHGKKQWSTNVLNDASASNTKWGLSGSPLIVDDLVVADANSALIAYERATGTIRWRTGDRKAGYSSPQLATLAGKAQILLFDGAGLGSYDPLTGAKLWQFTWETMYEMNSIQPLVLENDRVFISSELKNGCALLQVKGPDQPSSSTWSVQTLWQNKNLAARYASPVTDGKNIFGLNNMQGVLTCLDVKTGALKWKGDREGPGQLLLADNALLLINGDNGAVALFATDSPNCKELARYPLLNDKTWNTPALAGDQLFVRNQAEIACLRLPRR